MTGYMVLEMMFPWVLVFLLSALVFCIASLLCGLLHG